MIQTIIAQSGTTVFHIAATYLGSPFQWSRIALISGTDDPFLFQPTVLTIPAAAAGSREAYVKQN